MIDCHFNIGTPPPASHHNQDNLISITMKNQSKNSMQKFSQQHTFSISCKKKEHNETEEYEQTWQNNYLNQAARQWCQNELNHHNFIEMKKQENVTKDRESKFKILGRKFSKSKRKQFQKYRAYAVKMKIPSFADIQRVKPKNEKKSPWRNHKNGASRNHLKQINDYIHPKLQELIKNSQKQSSITFSQENKSANLFHKRTIKSQNQKKVTIRRKSINAIKNQEKKKTFEPNFVRSSNQYFKTSLSPRGLRKLKMSLEDSNNSYCQKRYNQAEVDENELKNISQFRGRSCKKEETIAQKAQLHEKNNLSPVRQYTNVSPIKQYGESTSNYLQKGINFKKNKKKQEKQKPASSMAKRQSSFNKSKEQYQQKNVTQYHQSPQKLLTRMIYTSKDMIRQKPRAISGKCDQQQSKDFKMNKVLVFNSEDKYIHRLLMDKQWIVNPDNRSKYYHLKWVFKPNSQDYNSIKQGQFINHIKNSHELTSKNYLNKNLKKSLSLWPNLNSHYPKCYDIAKGSERQQFFEQFVKEFMMTLLQKLYFYLKEYREEDVQKYQQFYQQLLDENGDYKTQNKNSSFLRRKQFRKIDLQDYKFYDSHCLVHMNLMIVALRYWRSLRKNLEINVDDHSFHFLTFTQKQFEDHLIYLQEYSKKVIPSFNGIDEPYFVKQFYATPSQITIERLVKQYVYFKHLLGKQWKIYGARNIWIIKPCSASRGNGIYLQNNSKQILFNSNGGIQSKIVQRYIQHPLIFQSPKYKQIANKKFDIRQWILLRSVDPLEIYMFSHCYVRICSEQYNINNINNLRSHLTNYSFNKHFYKNRSESVLDHESFTDLLKQECQVDYQTVLKPKIIQIVIKSIKSSQQLLDDYSQRCFSLLGYDILLDEQCNPWLLEVNMSPACQERTQWLKQYLNEMGKGLLNIILPANYLSIQPNTKVQSSLNTYEQKMKTQMNKQKQQSEYIRKNTEQNKGKSDPQLIQQDFSEDHESINEQIQITYADFINQHNVQTLSPEKRIQGEPFRVQIPINCLENGYTNNLKNSLQIDIVQNEKQLPDQQDCVKLQNEQNDSESENRFDQNGSSPLHPCNFSNNNPDKGSKSLKWELICLEEYYHPKKDKDLCLQIVGVKISSDKLQENDQKLDHWEKYQEYIQESILKVQRRIKTFLINKQLKAQFKKNESNQSLRVNFSRLIKRKSQRQSKSVYCATEENNKSIWHYSYLHFYQDTASRSIIIERPLTSRAKYNLKGVGRMKSSSDIKIGDLMKQFVAKGRFIYQEDLNLKKTISNIAVKHQRLLQNQIKQDKQCEMKQQISNQYNKNIEKQDQQYSHGKFEVQ